MIKTLEKSARTEDEAIAAALAELGMDRDDVSVEIVERAKSGFLGIGASPAVIRVSYEVEDEPAAPAAAPKAEAAPAAPAEAAPAEAVVDENEFKIVEILTKYAVDAFSYIFFHAVYGNNHRKIHKPIYRP